MEVVNDILVAVWSTVGSVMFFSGALTHAGSWFLVVGSLEPLVRPVIRLTRQFHLQRLPGRHGVEVRRPGKAARWRPRRRV